jgi:hypothetical protein
MLTDKGQAFLERVKEILGMTPQDEAILNQTLEMAKADPRLLSAGEQMLQHLAVRAKVKNPQVMQALRDLLREESAKAVVARVQRQATRASNIVLDLARLPFDVSSYLYGPGGVLVPMPPPTPPAGWRQRWNYAAALMDDVEETPTSVPHETRAGSYYGWRVWNIQFKNEFKDVRLLGRSMSHVAWKVPMQARCGCKSAFPAHALESSPPEFKFTGKCEQCGIHAYFTPEPAVSDAHDVKFVRMNGATECFPTYVLGRVELWGEVAVCQTGYRAEWAQPDVLFMPGDGVGMLARRLAEKYECRVKMVPLPVWTDGIVDGSPVRFLVDLTFGEKVDWPDWPEIDGRPESFDAELRALTS